MGVCCPACGNVFPFNSVGHLVITNRGNCGCIMTEDEVQQPASVLHSIKDKEGVKYDQGKAPIGLIPRQALEAEAHVMAYGATKYGRDNWRGGMDWRRLVDASLRHILSFADGEDCDPETGLSHLAHARCCLAFLIAYMELGLGRDDRHSAQTMKENTQCDYKSTSAPLV